MDLQAGIFLFQSVFTLPSELETVRNIMSVFGVTFIAGSALNVFKGYYIREFVDVMVE